jgi:ADP-ribose pyrophosphatase YjhB (NUDIX family)
MSTELPPRGLREISHGGVTVRGDRLLVITPRGKRADLLALPKGGANAGESGEEAAAREVLEETGVTAEVLEPLGTVEYWYRRSGHSVFKTVHFYLCRHIAGEPTADGVEVSQAKWIPLADAPKALAYKGEREMVERALSKLAAER